MIQQLHLRIYYIEGNEITALKRHLHTLFAAALFTIAKTCKQPKCPPVDEWIKKMWYKEFPLWLSGNKSEEYP